VVGGLLIKGRSGMRMIRSCLFDPTREIQGMHKGCMCVFLAPGRELASLIPRDTWVVMVGR
jgi:hypothetical protein